jgi:hypothetical protein
VTHGGTKKIIFLIAIIETGDMPQKVLFDQFLVGARSAPTTIFCVVFVVLYTIGAQGVGVKLNLGAVKTCPKIANGNIFQFWIQFFS